MRPTLAPLLGLAFALAASAARADPPRLTVQLDYARGRGAETCPAEPDALRAEVARHLGYDPFDVGAAAATERLVVTLSRPGRELAARIERYTNGALTWSEVFPGRGHTCASLMSPLAAELRSLLITFQAPPASPPGAAPAAPPDPAPPPAPTAPLAPKVEATPSPEPPIVPDPARSTASRVAIVSYALTGIFLGLGIGWTVDARSKSDTAESLSLKLQHTEGKQACSRMGSGAPEACSVLVSALQSASTSTGIRNAWYAAAGASAAAGITSTILALTLPRTMKGQPTPQLSVNPAGVRIQGSF